MQAGIKNKSGVTRTRKSSVKAKTISFAAMVASWQRKHGRKDLPWQQNPNPYTTWLSEIMLQQTQVSAVIPYYLRFITRFPDVQTLAAADNEEVMNYWSGLGYYARARNLHKTAKHIAANGFPKNATEWQTMHGVGKSTAAAISVFSHNQRAAILDGNVKRVLVRAFAIKTPLQDKQTIDKLWQLSEQLLPKNISAMRAYTQGMMDLGATICTRRPQCDLCPLATICKSKKLKIQNTLPHRNISKQKPNKHKTMAFITYRHAILLHKRPASGIWGGLYSLPEADDTKTLIKNCRQIFDCTLTPLTVTSNKKEYKSESFIHQFTHFHLQAQVLFFVPNTNRITSSDYQWISKRNLSNTPLPAPIRKFLNQFWLAKK